MTGKFRIRMLTKAQTNVPVGYTTHNGASKRVCFAPTREAAKAACDFANHIAEGTLRERGDVAKRFIAKYPTETK